MKNVYLFLTLLLLSSCFLGGCSKDETPQGTIISGTLESVIPARKTATVSGRFSGSITGIKEFGFLYSTDDPINPGGKTTRKLIITESFSVNKTYVATLEGLLPNTSYFYCMYVSNGTNIMQTASSNFKTLETSKALLGEMRLDGTGEYSVIVSCDILDDGGTSITQCGFYYKNHSSAGGFTSKPATKESFKVTIDNLSPGVVYDIFPFATNSDGMASGDTLQISTEGFEAPVVKTFDVTDGMFGADWVLLSGLVENKGSSDVEERGFCYSTTNEEPTVADKIVNITTTDFKYKLTSLQPDTRYYVRAYARNHTKVGYGKKVVFKTLTVVGPTFLEVEVGEVTDVSAKVQSKVTLGSGEIKRMGFCYSTTGVPSITNGKSVDVTELKDGALSTTLEGLTPGASYQVCAFIENSSGPFYSKPVALAMSDDPVPIVSEVTFSNVGKTSFDVSAEVLSKVKIVKQVFLYGLTNSLKLGGTGVSEKIMSGNSAQIANLKPNTTYYVCAYASNEAGKEAYGKVGEIKTAAAGLPIISGLYITKDGLQVKVEASVSSEPGAPITECGICYSASNAVPTVNDSKVNASLSGSKISGQIQGADLKPSTTYYIRIYAISASGTAYSEVKTVSFGLPVVTALTVTRDGFQATVKASVSSESSIIECGICYSTTNSTPTVNDTKVSATQSYGSITGQITDLKPSSIYYIRVYATSSAGTGYSEVKSLTIGSNVPGVDDNQSPDQKN